MSAGHQYTCLVSSLSLSLTNCPHHRHRHGRLALCSASRQCSFALGRSNDLLLRKALCAGVFSAMLQWCCGFLPHWPASGLHRSRARLDSRRRHCTRIARLTYTALHQQPLAHRSIHPSIHLCCLAAEESGGRSTNRLAVWMDTRTLTRRKMLSVGMLSLWLAAHSGCKPDSHRTAVAACLR